MSDLGSDSDDGDFDAGDDSDEVCISRAIGYTVGCKAVAGETLT